MKLRFAKRLELHISKTKIDTQMMDGSKLYIFGMVITSFLINNKTEKLWDVSLSYVEIIQ